MLIDDLFLGETPGVAYKTWPQLSEICFSSKACVPFTVILLRHIAQLLREIAQAKFPQEPWRRGQLWNTSMPAGRMWRQPAVNIRGLPQRSCKSMTRPEHRAAMRNVAWLCNVMHGCGFHYGSHCVLWADPRWMCVVKHSVSTPDCWQNRWLKMITHFKKPWVTSST